MIKKEKEKLKKELIKEFNNSDEINPFWRAARVLTFWPEPLFKVKKK